jgi:hypothetical protein
MNVLLEQWYSTGGTRIRPKILLFFCNFKTYYLIHYFGSTGRSGFDPRRGQRMFPLASVSRPAVGFTQPPVQWVPGGGGPFPGGKARQGRDADQSPPSSAEVVNEYELYVLSPQAPPWRVEGLFYLLLLLLYFGCNLFYLF